MPAPLRTLLMVAALALTPIATWAAELETRIDLSDQEMTVVLGGVTVFKWPVSTARPGKVTPTGTFVPQSMQRDHRSSIYNDAPMPFSIFFSGNYAIHGTTETEKLGCPVSAGCVRLHPKNAETLFELTRKVGMENSLIVIQD